MFKKFAKIEAEALVYRRSKDASQLVYIKQRGTLYRVDRIDEGGYLIEAKTFAKLYDAIVFMDEIMPIEELRR